MSSTLDPSKLKVVDLRSELTTRGLDSKGNKAVLVKRLQDALDAEAKAPGKKAGSKTPEKPKSEPPPKATPRKERTSSHVSEDSDEKMEAEEVPPEKPKSKSSQKQKQEPPIIEASEENGEHDEQLEEETPNQDEVKKSKETEETSVEGKETEDIKDSADKTEDSERDTRGEKRKRSASPESATQKRRRSKSASPEQTEQSSQKSSKTPVKEDEPPLDSEKVQLSWYDSDLHLQLDKESFLSAKPLNDGAFGYAWAGVRATHGISSGKICYEVKITEELKWEDFAKPFERRRTDKKTPKKDSAAKGSDKPEEKKSENGEKTEAVEGEKKESNSNVATEKTEEEAGATTETEEVKTEATEEKTEATEGKTEADVKKASKDSDEKTEDEKKDEKPAEESDKKEEPKEPEKTLDPLPTHLFRVGWSRINTGLQLGEQKYSYAYESSGKFVSNKNFEEYGKTFGVGDVIGSFLSIDSDVVTITYTVNGELQSTATTIPRSELPEENFVLFPHVLSRNYAFELNLGNKDEPWFPIPEELEEYVFLEKFEERIPGPIRPETRSECEVILMCGLPASGKTHWVREHMKANPEKNYTVLGNTHLLEKMTIAGAPLKGNYRGRWSILMDRLQKCLNKLIETAAERRRNYIIDQTNVFPSAQRRKLRQFEGFKRRAVVVVVGDEEQAKRQSLQEAQDGKDVPDSTIFEMKANMTLPQTGEWLDEIVFAGLPEAEAKELVQKYNAIGKDAGYGPGGHRKISRRDDRWQNRRNDFRGKYGRDRTYQNSRYERGPRGGYDSRSSYGGGYARDRRDARGGGGSRDWRYNRLQTVAQQDRGYSHAANYNRPRPQTGGRGQGNWQNSGWGGSHGSQGGWNTQTFSHQGTWTQGWGGQSGQGQGQNQWKYGGSGGGSGQGYNYGNWNNYYGQYGQNWGGQQGQTSYGAEQGQTTANTPYGQGYSQQAWAQYAQQYAAGYQARSYATSQSAPQN